MFITILLIISAFFSANEIALASISITYIHEMKNRKHRRAGILAFLKNKQEQVISTILLANTLANIAISSIATRMFINFYGEEEGVLFATLATTITILLLAEVFPKTYAVQQPEKVALFSAPIMFTIFKLLHPITFCIQASTTFLIKILKLYKPRTTIALSDVIRNLVSLHTNRGTMSQRDIDMLNSVLDLSETTIAQIMTHRNNVFTLNIDDDKEAIIAQLLKSNYSKVPLYRGTKENIVGILYIRNVINSLRMNNNDSSKISLDKMISKPWFVPDTTLLSVQLHNFRIKKVHFALIVDEYGDFQGIITLYDILEEIVGEIYDEYRKQDNDITFLSNNEYIFSGRVLIRDINRKINWDLPEDNASTIAGMLINTIKRIPDKGEEFKIGNFIICILQKENNMITKLHIKRLINIEEQDLS